MSWATQRECDTMAYSLRSRRLFSVLVTLCLLLPLLPVQAKQSPSHTISQSDDQTVTVSYDESVDPAAECTAYQDEVFGYSFCRPVGWSLLPASGEPASQTVLLSPTASQDGGYEGMMELGVILYDRDPAVDLGQWVRPSTSLASSFTRQYATVVNGIESIVQEYAVGSRLSLRVYVPNGSRVFYADFEPRGSDLEDEFWSMLKTYLPGDHDVGQILTAVAYPEIPAALGRADSLTNVPSVLPPTDLSLPFSGDHPMAPWWL
jgi:hypothetical protein